MNRFVVFDTNGYRNLVHGKSIIEIKEIIESIKLKEKEAGIEPWISCIVWIELFAHLNDTEDPHFEDCLKAVYASFLHTMISADCEEVRFMPDASDIIVNILFNKNEINSKSKEQYHSMMKLALEIYNKPEKETALRLCNYFNSYKHISKSRKKEFLQNFIELDIYNTFKANYLKDKSEITTTSNTKLKDELFSQITINLLKLAYKEVNIEINTIDKSIIENQIRLIKKYFSGVIYFIYDIIVKIIVNTNLNIEKKENWVWDYELMFLLSESINNIMLVTNDKDMIDAAKSALLGNKVMMVDYYKNILGL